MAAGTREAETDRTEQQAATGNLARPPQLLGYTFSPDKAWAARDAGRLLSLRLETNRSCNLRCRYCYALSGGSQTQELDYDILADTVRQAADMGAESIVVIGGGEPTLYPHFRRLVRLIAELGPIPVVFTNGLRMTRDLADFLYAHNASVMGKMDSLDPARQDFLAGAAHAAQAIRQGLNNLIDAGFADRRNPRLRLGLSFVSCRMNLDEIDAIWRFCRDRNIFPNMEVLTPTGRALRELPDQWLATEEIQDYKLRLLEIDRREYGYDWLPHTPLAASGCLQHLYSLYVTIEGNVRPCAPTKFDEHPDLFENGAYPHNINARSLRGIYNDPLFEYVRHIDTHLQGKCRSCAHNAECIGCRGYAYSVGVNEGLAPRDALALECRQCLRQEPDAGPASGAAP